MNRGTMICIPVSSRASFQAESRTPDIGGVIITRFRAFFINRGSSDLEPKTVRFFQRRDRVATYGYPNS